MKEINMKNYRKLLKVLIYIVFLLLLVFSFSKKFNLNIDEVYSYGLANHYGDRSMTIEDGLRYVPASTPWLNYVTVSRDHRFDYKNVWANQTSDVHPPFYYVILHTICSCFPGRFSKWYGGVINIFFCIAALFVFGKIIRIYTEDYRVETVSMAAFALSPAFLNMAMFIRMYTMAMFCVMLFTYFYIRYVRGEEGRKLLTALTATAVLGALTHYYCMIFVVLLSFSFGVYCLIKRKISALIKYTVSMGISAGLCIIIFPGMLGHFFSSDRGEQTISNAGSDSVLKANLVGDIRIVIGELFGNPVIFGIAIVAVLLLMIMGIKKRHIRFCTEFVLVGVAIFAYMVMIAATAPYAADRYFFPIYGIALTLVLIVCTNVILTLCKRSIALVVTVVFFCVMLSTAFVGMEWGYTDSFTRESVEWAKDHADLDAIMIHGKRFRMHTSFFEASEYAGLTMVDSKDLSKLPDTSEYADKDFVLMVAVKEEDDEFLEEVMKKYPGHTYTKVAFSAYHNSYYFEKEN